MKFRVLFLFILIPLTLLGQGGGINSTVLLKGKIYNYQTRSPLEIKFFLIDENGKKIPVKSSNDGSFHIPLNKFGNYVVFAENWLCIDPVALEIQSQQSYYEKEANLFLVPLEPGVSIRKAVAFEESSYDLTNDGKNALNFLATLSKNNPKLSFIIVIRTNQSLFKKTTHTIVKGKKKTKVLVTPEDQAKAISEKRAETIQNLLTELKVPRRNYSFSFEFYSSIDKTTQSKKAKKQQSPKNAPLQNLEILVDKALKLDLDKK